MWQECPICKGKGKIQKDFGSDFKICDTCNGKKIISQLTGLPPLKENKCELPENKTCFCGANIKYKCADNRIYTECDNGHQEF